MQQTLAIDLGGTNIRAGLYTDSQPAAITMLGRWDAPASLKTFAVLVKGLIDNHGVERIAIAIPGLVRGTECIWAPNLPYLDEVDIASVFPDVALTLGNDARLALLAEATTGAAARLDHAILLAIGTGIGSAVLSGRRLLHGWQGTAASFGWACADLTDDGNDRLGWLERQASGVALDALAQEVGLSDGPALLNESRKGSGTARSLLERPCAALGVSLAGAVSLLGTEAVILTGGVAEGFEELAPLVIKAMRRHLPLHLREIGVIKGLIGPNANLIGAGLAAHGSKMWEGTQ